MNSDDKDDRKSLDEDSFFQDDYEEESIDYDDESPFDDEPEFEEEDFDLAPDEEPLQETDQNESWHDEDVESQDEEYSQPWPLGLFAAGIIALLLLAAGGYGVLEQRLEMQKEVRLLRAKLATTTSNTEVAESRQAQRNLQIHNEELQAQIELLEAESTGLRKELTRAKSEAAAQETSTKIKSAPPKAPPTIVQDAWFVNFGSYKSKATADGWASKLSVNAGRVAVVSGENKGTLYYRVRIIDLPSKEIAGKIALKLQQTHHLSRLWVGKQ